MDDQLVEEKANVSSILASAPGDLPLSVPVGPCGSALTLKEEQKVRLVAAESQVSLHSEARINISFGSNIASLSSNSNSNSNLDPKTTPRLVVSNAEQISSVNRVLGRIGDYDLLEEVASTPVARFYRAYSKTVQKDVAIKVISPELCQEAALLKRFKQEARAASELNHPNLCSVYDFGVTESGCAYMVTDFLKGSSLKSVIEREGFLDPERALEIFRQVCHGLSHLHQHDLVHRNLNPSNIFLVETESQHDFVKVVDFGLGRIMSASRTDDEKCEADFASDPRYMSPEQVMGYKLDCRSDMYSLGLIMYEALCGKQAFSAHNRVQTIMKQLNGKPRPFRSMSNDLEISDELERIIFKCLEKNRSSRYASLSDLCMDLELCASQSDDLKTKLSKKQARKNKSKKIKKEIVYIALASFALVLAGSFAMRHSHDYRRAQSMNNPQIWGLGAWNNRMRDRNYADRYVPFEELRKLAEDKFDKQEYDDAIGFYQRAIEKYKRIMPLNMARDDAQKHELADLYTGLGNSYLYKESGLESQMIPVNSNATVLNAPQNPLYHGNIKDRHAEEALDAAVASLDNKLGVDQLDLLWAQSDVKFRRNKNSEAVAYYKRIIDVLKTNPNNESLELVYANIGRISVIEGDFDAAEKWFKKALDTDRKFFKPFGTGAYNTMITADLANVYYSQGRLADAEKLSKENIKIIRDLQLNPEIIVTSKTDLKANYDLLFKIYSSQGKKKEANKAQLMSFQLGQF